MNVREAITELLKANLDSKVQMSIEYSDGEIYFYDIDFITPEGGLEVPTLINVSWIGARQLGEHGDET